MCLFYKKAIPRGEWYTRLICFFFKHSLEGHYIPLVSLKERLSGTRYSAFSHTTSPQKRRRGAVRHHAPPKKKTPKENDFIKNLAGDEERWSIVPIQTWRVFFLSRHANFFPPCWPCLLKDSWGKRRSPAGCWGSVKWRESVMKTDIPWKYGWDCTKGKGRRANTRVITYHMLYTTSICYTCYRGQGRVSCGVQL